MVSCTPFLIVHAHTCKQECISRTCTNADIIFFWTLCLSTNLLMKHDISEAGSVSVFRQVAQWLGIAPSKGSTKLGAFLVWRQMHSRLPECRALLKILMMEKVQKKKIMSESHIPLSEPSRFEFNKHVIFQEPTYKELSQA